MKNGKATERSYDRLASVYDRRWRFYVRETVRITARFVELPPAGRVLDVGCGTGELLHALVGRQARRSFVGVDLSAGMLSEAQRKLGTEAQLVRASASRLPFRDASFAAVVSSSALHFFSDPATALVEMRRVLQPGGRLVLTDWCRDYLSCRMLDRFLQYTDPGHGRPLGSAQLLGLLRDSGFEPERLERYKISWLWGMMTVRCRVGEGWGRNDTSARQQC